MKLRIVCTNRGEHPRTRLAIYDSRPVDVPPWMDYQIIHEPGDDVLTWWLTPHGVHMGQCPRCPRRPRIAEDALRRLVAEYEAAGLDVLDISTRGLPF